MNPISSIDSSIYSGLIESVQTFSTRQGLDRPVESVSENDSPVDLSGYYQNTDLLTQVGENVAQSAEALNDAMVSALENGWSVQDVCNIKLAEQAYKANCKMFKSTFELRV